MGVVYDEWLQKNPAEMYQEVKVLREALHRMAEVLITLPPRLPDYISNGQECVDHFISLARRNR